MPTELQFLGQKINKLRLELGETMEQFGKRFNTSKGTVNNWEKGRNSPNKENLLLLSKLAKTSVEDFLFGVSKKDITDVYNQYFQEIPDQTKREFIKTYLSKNYTEELYDERFSNIVSIENKIKVAEDEYYFKQKMETLTTFEFLEYISEKMKLNLFDASLELESAIFDYSLIERIGDNEEEKDFLKILLWKISIQTESIQKVNEFLQKKANEHNLILSNPFR